MKSVKLGRLRINLDHLVWYSPSGREGSDDPSEEPAISLKTTDSPAALSIRYPTLQKRDADMALLDNLFDVAATPPVIEHNGPTTPEPADPVNAETGRKKSLPAGLEDNREKRSPKPGSHSPGEEGSQATQPHRRNLARAKRKAPQRTPPPS